MDDQCLFASRGLAEKEGKQRGATPPSPRQQRQSKEAGLRPPPPSSFIRLPPPPGFHRNPPRAPDLIRLCDWSAPSPPREKDAESWKPRPWLDWLEKGGGGKVCLLAKETRLQLPPSSSSSGTRAKGGEKEGDANERERRAADNKEKTREREERRLHTRT